VENQPKTPLAEIRGQVPSLHELPGGCTYADRCPLAQPRCRAQPPALRKVNGEHHNVRCWRADETEGYRDDGTFAGEKFIQNFSPSWADGAGGGQRQFLD
jgi:hypothetical protein